MTTIEVWSDFDCPYCYISKHQLKNELKKYNLSFDLKMLPYQLSPEKFNEPERTFFDALELTSEKDILNARKTLDSIIELGKTVGLTLNLYQMRSVNTALAHKLCLWAREKDKSKVDALIDLIFYAQFTLNEDISNETNLISYAIKAGYSDEAMIKEALYNDAYENLLNDYLDLSYEKEIELIPHYYLPNNIEFAGIPPIQEMNNRLKIALNL